MAGRHDSTRAKIRRALVQRILDGTYQPGDRLVELQIAGEFRSSQGPVREALRELEALRLVESVTYRGTRVRGISEPEMCESTHVRGVLEEEAAKLGAEALAKDIGPLREQLEGIRKAARKHDLDAYAEQNMEFHRTVVKASGNSVLLRLWDSLMLEVRVRVGLNQRSFNLEAVAESHAPIVEALARGDGVEAGRLLRAHAGCFSAPDRIPPEYLAEPAAAPAPFTAEPSNPSARTA
ncbi:GntR family transcriptional regulator [Singulisphaera sp. PoT]|uniref:GntR family transcriptional regulator n=1 Tax=Singulisphaera sp. PoT TaxID=3411797 RepID=UPI003BF61B5B